MAGRGRPDMQLQAACIAAGCIKPLFPGPGVRPEHPALVGRSSGSAWSLLEPDPQHTAFGPSHVHRHPGGRPSSHLSSTNWAWSRRSWHSRSKTGISRYNDDAILNIRQEEYRQFVLGADTASRDAREFEVRSFPLPDALHPYFSRIVRVVRLREVRALKGFTRINPPGDEDSPDIAAISVGEPGWLPAVEVRGEGIFLAFNQETLRRWEIQDLVEDRARKVHGAWCIEWRNRYGEGDPAWRITARYLLAHTFAHALMRQLTLECGYSTAALRERLYVSDREEGMTGLLIYTATSDSDGTLGGLQRQGESHRVERAVDGCNPGDGMVFIGSVVH